MPSERQAYGDFNREEGLTWCDGCHNRRPCITRKSGVIYEGKDCEIHLCRWCRGHETRRSVTKD